MFLHLRIPCSAQPGGAVLDGAAIHGGHFSGGRAFTRGIGKDVQPCQIAFLNQLEAIGKVGLSLGREACDDIGAKRHAGAQAAGFLAELDRVITQVTTFHPLEDQVRPMLQAEV